MAVNVVKSIILILLGGVSVAVMTWGLITNDGDSNGVLFAVLGLLAYLATWMVGLYAVAQ